jgi:hypothetical protein
LAEKAGNGWAFCLLATVVSFAPSGVSPVDARPFLREVEAAWLERLKRARSRYEEKVALARLKRARSRYEEKVAIRKQMVAERAAWPIGLAPDPDGRFVLNLALQEESAARTEYMRLLRIFTELILHGTPADDEPGS